MTLEEAYKNWQKYRDKPDSEARKQAHHELIYAGYQERLRVGDKGTLGVPELEAHKAEDFRKYLGMPAEGGAPTPKSGAKKKIFEKKVDTKKKDDSKNKTNLINRLREAGPIEVDIPANINARY